MTAAEVWHRRLSERPKSPEYGVGFVWQSGRLYVMDNHRVALWCWWRHLTQARGWQLLHIDRHTDTLSSQLDIWVREVEKLRRRYGHNSVPLDVYLNLSYKCGGVNPPVIRWDNYLSIFLSMHNKQLVRVVFATAGEGDEPAFGGLNLEKLNPREALRLAELIGSESEHSTEPPWLVNVDLDYFTAEDFRGRMHHLFSDANIVELGHALASGLRKHRIGCATVALSPVTTGGWQRATDLMHRFLSPWGMYPHIG